MEFQKASLELKRFHLLSMKYEFIATQSILNDSKKINELMNNLPIEIEFFLENTEIAHIFNIYCRIFINKDTSDGYNIFAEGIGIFSLEKSETKDIESHSGVALGVTIGKLRDCVSIGTNTSPYGSYELPLVDLQKIIESKNNPLDSKD